MESITKAELIKLLSKRTKSLKTNMDGWARESNWDEVKFLSGKVTEVSVIMTMVENWFIKKENK